MKLFYRDGKEPEHSELEALEKLYMRVMERNSYLKLLEGIDEICLKIIRDIRKEEFF